MRGCLFGAKVWFGTLGTQGCGSGGALCTKNLHLDIPIMQHVTDACTSRSPSVNAIFERDPAQAQAAAVSVWEGCW
eukprot:1144061-Pelagomonas_calceolata.AAC.4